MAAGSSAANIVLIMEPVVQRFLLMTPVAHQQDKTWSDQRIPFSRGACSQVDPPSESHRYQRSKSPEQFAMI